MLIKALCDYAEKQADTGIPEGWQEHGIHYRILLTPEGEIKDIVDVRGRVEDPAKGGKTKLTPKTILLPFRQRKTGVSAYYMDDRPIYIFGLDYDKQNDCLMIANAKRDDPKKHPVLVEHELSFFSDLDSDICRAYCNFLKNWDPLQMMNHPALIRIAKEYSNSSFGFSLGIGMSNLEDDEQFRQKYHAFRTNRQDADETANMSFCSILGEKLPRKEIHDPIVFPGTNFGGCAFVSVNEQSSESYGFKQGLNCSISEKAMKEYTYAFNDLLKSQKHHKILGELVIIYFALKEDDEEECSLFSGFLESTNQNAEQENYELDELFKLSSSGKTNNLAKYGFDDKVEFYIAGFTLCNKARIAQKFIVHSQFGRMIGNLIQHQEDLRIGNNTKQISFSQIAKQLLPPEKGKKKESNKKSVPPSLMTALMLAAINGTRYPDGLLSTVIRRVKTDSDEEKKHYIKLNDIRAGIIKACINRKAQKEEIKLAWDEKNLNPAYLCGGLFAVYEKIQQDASGSGQGLNRTIKDAYFASACSRPASVMPKLAMLSQNHLKKVKAKFDEKRVNYYQKQLGILMDGLVDGFPITLSLEDQGRFIVGYYHMNRRLWTAAEKKEDTKNA